MSDTKITVYGAYWCPDCMLSKQFLGEHQVPYQFVNIDDDKEAEKYITDLNNGKRIIPTITFDDGSFLVWPSNTELAKKLGLVSKGKRTHYDLIVIGAGPAGLLLRYMPAARPLIRWSLSEQQLVARRRQPKSWIMFPGFLKVFPVRLFPNVYENKLSNSVPRYCRLRK